MGLDIYFNKIKKQSDEIGYFRKVNFLVSFVEDLLGREIINCEEVPFDKQMAEELVRSCKEVLSAKADIKNYCEHQHIPDNEIGNYTPEMIAEELLPTRPGFFFGNTDYDEWYYHDVEEVLNWCESTLLPEFNDLDVDEQIYFSIWY